ncbi:coiled-coil domain-containing protein 50 isoform X1 [Pleurodeles waltl]|uniref:coiled-coil domain-containing protein 50 isoform X1 n=1 Tax=Pleurodeles waltl TaxID=8319 RepID=UPI00370983AB
MEPSIDQQRLPGVREVCRDFAVLEDHSLAHNLQEQEIEHHLATNIQRSRLVQHDLVVAKQLQEEEDLRAQERLKKLHKDLERQDCEIAQEIQEKLVIEADRRRRQEEKDEDIARLLQEKELKEEKKRKKPFLEPLAGDDGSFHLAPAHSRGRNEEHQSDIDRPRRTRSGEPPGRSRDDRKRSPAVSSGDVQEHGHVSDRFRRHSDDPGERDGELHRAPDRSSPRKPRPQRPPAPKTSRDAVMSHSPRELVCGDDQLSVGEKSTRSRELTNSAVPNNDEYYDLKEGARRDHKRIDHLEPNQKGHGRRSPSPYNGRDAARDAGHHRELGRPDDSRCGRERCTRTQGRSPERGANYEEFLDLKVLNKKDHKRVNHLEPKQTGDRRRSTSPYSDRNANPHKDAGMRSRGTRDAAYSKPRVEVQSLGLDDAVIARRLQEEELRVSLEDERAAQVAQDEEIARLFMEREKKAYRKQKSCEKPSQEKRPPDDWNLEVNEHGHSRSRDRQEHPRSRNDKPSRPPPPAAEVISDLESSLSFEKQSSSTRPFSKSQTSPKGPSYRQ